MTAEREGLADLLLAHRGWAETGPNDNGSWNLVCHTCGAHLLTMWGTYVSEEDRDELQAGHVADALTDILAARDRRVRAEALREAADNWPREVNVETIRREIATFDLRETPPEYRVNQWLRDRADWIEADQ